MKKILTILIGLILAVSLVSAIDRSPQPRPFSLFFKYNNENVVGLDVTFRIGDQSVVKTTNRFGGVGVDLDLGYSPDFSIGRGLSDWDLYSQVLVVSCDLDLCDKVYAFKDFSTPYDETFVLSKAPPVTCSPCNCGGGGGGSCSYTEAKCNNLYPCEDTNECPIIPCEVCKVCEDCPVTEDCEVCKSGEVCPECEKPSTTVVNIVWGLIALVLTIAGLVLGGYSWYPGFKGLATWRIKEGIKALEEGDSAEAKKQFEAAFKSLKTAVERAKEGKYE